MTPDCDRDFQAQLKAQYIAAELQRLNTQFSQLLELERYFPPDTPEWWDLQELITAVEDEIEELAYSTSS